MKRRRRGPAWASAWGETEEGRWLTHPGAENVKSTPDRLCERRLNDEERINDGLEDVGKLGEDGKGDLTECRENPDVDRLSCENSVEDLDDAVL